MRITRNLRGASVVQMAIVLAVVTMVVIASVQLLGTATSDEMDSAAVSVGNPAGLADSYGGAGQSGGSGGSGGSDGGDGSDGSDGGGSDGGGSDGGGSDGGGSDDGGSDDGGSDDGSFGGLCP